MKKRKTRIIQISGIRGILTAIFVAACLAAGFIGFPGLVAMHLWNYAASFTYSMPVLNIYQGILLWAIVGISGFIINDRKKFIVSMKAPEELSDEEMKKLMERVKIQSQAQMLNSMILKSNEIKTLEKEKQSSEIKDEQKSEETKDVHNV
ncbi:MAG: hypothetical protein ACLSWI_00805 [Candidatus Gastranaerophilaceae bacterium]